MGVTDLWRASKPRPLLDNADVIMAVVAGSPKNNHPWWESIHNSALKDLQRIAKTADFSDVGEAKQHHLRFGMTFGEDFTVGFP